MRMRKSLSFRLRILLCFLAVASLPLCVNGALTYVFELTIKKQAAEEQKTKLKEIKNQVEQLFIDCNLIIKSLEDGGFVKAVTGEKGIIPENEIYSELYRIAGIADSGRQISFYNGKGELSYSTNNISVNDLPVNWGALRKASGQEHIIYYAWDLETDKQGLFLVSALKRIGNDEKNMEGFIETGFGRDKIERIFSGYLSPGMNGYFADEFGHVIYDSAGLRSALEYREIRHICNNIWLENGMNQNGLEYLAVTLEPSGYYIILEYTAAVSRQASLLIRTISAAGVFLSLAVCMLLAFLLSRSLSEPISQMTKAMGKIQDGDLNIRLSIRRRDELGQLSDSFNQMVETLQKNMDTIKARGKELNEAQIQLLQSQLNPHFLYNTLDTVKWLAKINHLPDIAHIVENLAVILRCCISKEQFIPLSQEVGMVLSYLDIQKIRFSNRFEYHMEISGEAKDCIVPKLILQPLIENSIIHGLEHGEGGVIVVKAIIREGLLLLSVSDNGCGMSRTLKDKINNNSIEKLEGHFGLYNLKNILQLSYGKEYGLRAAGEEGTGTVITAVLPVVKEEKSD